jgi:hypothetical protein
MIDDALKTLADQAQGFLERNSGSSGDLQGRICLANVVNPEDGSVALEPDSLGLCLVNIEEERVTKSQRASAPAAGRVAYLNPELKLNLHVLIAANYKVYRTGLHFLSSVIRFFQAKSVFTPENTPELASGIQKLIVEMYTLNLEQQNHLWGALGAKYLPSVFYKVRMLTIQEELVAEEQPPITVVDFSSRGVMAK